VCTSIGYHACPHCWWSDINNTQGQFHKLSLHSSTTITPTTPSAYINHAVASFATNQVGAIGRGGPLGWRHSGKVMLPQTKGLGFNPHHDQKDRKKLKGRAKKKRQEKKEKTAEKPS
jgi:hypothetical protein